MSAPAGDCEWCGGPQQWTIHHGEMYVRCEYCLGLLPEDQVTILPPISEETLPYLEGRDEGGTYSRMEGVPCEGSEPGD